MNDTETVTTLRHGYETTTVEAAAERLGVDTNVIDRWIEKGHILIVRGPSNEPLVLAVPFERLYKCICNRTSVKDMERIWHSLA